MKYIYFSGKFAFTSKMVGTHRGGPIQGWHTYHQVLCILLYRFIMQRIPHFFCRYFLFLDLDKVVCPFMVKYFAMPIWHPTSEKALDELLDAKVDL